MAVRGNGTSTIKMSDAVVPLLDEVSNIQYLISSFWVSTGNEYTKIGKADVNKKPYTCQEYWPVYSSYRKKQYKNAVN